ELTDFGHRQLDEIFPIGRPIREPQLAGLIANSLIIQTPAADVTEEVMDLVDGQDGRSRVVDRRRQTFPTNVNNDANTKVGVFLWGALLANGDRLAKRVFRQSASALV